MGVADIKLDGKPAMAAYEARTCLMGAPVKGSIMLFYFVIPLILVWNSILIDKDAHTYWMDTHWLFNYEHGFVKRGLIGELFRQFGPDMNLETLAVAQTATIIAASAGFLAVVTWFVLRSYRSNAPWHNATIFAVGLLLLTAPGALRQTVYEIGRFDAFGLATLCALVALTRLSQGLWSFLFLAGAIVFAIFVHEAHFFWVVPLSLWLWAIHTDQQAPLAVPLLSICAVAVAAVLITGNASYGDYMGFDEAKAVLAMNTDVPIVNGSLKVQFRSLDDNVALTAKNSFSYRRIIGCLLGLVSLLPYLFVLVTTVRGEEKTKLRWGLLAAFAPLLLVVVGHDQGRWLAMANVSLCLVVIALLPKAQVTRTQAKIVIPLIGVASLCQLLLGPFGNIVPYPFVMRLI